MARWTDALPAGFWRVGNLHLGGRLHFCYDHGAVRTIEWNGRALTQGRRAGQVHWDA